MPKQTGFIKIKGTLNGVCYYPLKGAYIYRTAVGPSKERIYNDPAFKPVKANLLEFGGASKLAKAICTGLKQNVAAFKDSYMTSRLSGCCRKIIQKGSGEPGQREANLFNQPELLIGFQLNKTKVFSQIYTVKPIITSNTARSVVNISIPKSDKYHLKQAPKTATHFRLTAALSIVSNYKWSDTVQGYQPQHPNSNGLGVTSQSSPLLCKIEHQNIYLQLINPISTGIPANTAITVWLGIQYGNMVQNEFSPFKTAQAMACVAVL
ncbi:hypothetical protein C1T31_08855 [Hanstruepera neustonica]|uniref:Uncharacterized protein n=1 Tax=Hanstruepera neustonica TaxID=1445657 RepID=A0A2K1DYI0_9FLAO|nr:hypothetical protein [Hanstruepera neustonica]PNQ73089.1 hypothetical protein C1T31_08855 [Hanstruepera neustonica]